jgi:hypothetical protein
VSIDEVNDDMGLAKRPSRVIACMAVQGRLPLLKYTIERLYKKNGCHKVICSGDKPEDRRLCEEMGAEWVQHRNNPLGSKWNAAFQAAAKHNPTACIFVGSSDWLSDNWIPVMHPYLDSYDLIGTPGCYFMHLADENLLCYWPGYVNQRVGESIGIGRMLSSKLLDKMQWKPFSDLLNNSLDGSMMQTSSRRAARVHLIDSSELKSVSISTNIWPNKHQFSDHYLGKLPSKKILDVDTWIENNFPEAKLVCESLKGMSVSL